jgi:hypothetical protein
MYLLSPGTVMIVPGFFRSGSLLFERLPRGEEVVLLLTAPASGVRLKARLARRTNSSPSA